MTPPVDEEDTDQLSFGYHPNAGGYPGLHNHFFDNTAERIDMPQSMLALFNFGEGQIILILILLLILIVPVAVGAGVIFLAVRANKRKRELSSAGVPAQIPPANP
jgi:hypothetical protein